MLSETVHKVMVAEAEQKFGRSRAGRVEASLLSAQLALLTNDALVVALMRRHALVDMVTNDNDFDGVPALNFWKPR